MQLNEYPQKMSKALMKLIVLIEIENASVLSNHIKSEFNTP